MIRYDYTEGAFLFCWSVCRRRSISRAKDEHSKLFCHRHKNVFVIYMSKQVDWTSLPGPSKDIIASKLGAEAKRALRAASKNTKSWVEDPDFQSIKLL